MANDYINEYCDKIRDEILFRNQAAEEAEKAGKYSLSSDYKNQSDTLWNALMFFYQIVLKRKKFEWEQLHAMRILRQLDPIGWEVWTSRKKKHKGFHPPDQAAEDEFPQE